MRKRLKMAIFALGFLATGVVSAQTTDANDSRLDRDTDRTKIVRLIDNKGTIKYLQAKNGITQITSTNGANRTTTTYQLGGELIDNTYITADGSNATATDKKIFALDGLELVTDITTASTNTDADLNGSSHTITPGGTVATTAPQGFTVLIRDEATGAVQKMRLSDLLQVQGVQEEVTVGATGASTANLTNAVATAAEGIEIDIQANINNVQVYRNGAKLRAGVDYALKTVTGTPDRYFIYLIEDTAAPVAPATINNNYWELYNGDIIEVHAFK